MFLLVAGELLPELDPPLLGSCLIHMLRRLPEPLVSCVRGGMHPRSHLISAQVLVTEERARLYSMQLMLDLVAQPERGQSDLSISKACFSACIALRTAMGAAIFAAMRALCSVRLVTASTASRFSSR